MENFQIEQQTSRPKRNVVAVTLGLLGLVGVALLLTPGSPVAGYAGAVSVRAPVPASASSVAMRASTPAMMIPEQVKCKIRQVATASALAATIAAAPALAGPTVKLGSDSGQLVFEPSEVTISKGDSITWVNNKGYPHNVIFDEEAVPSGVDAEKLSTPDQLGEEGQKHTAKFDVAGTYEYYCEPHRGAGMAGMVIVK
jgi:plastocyanin